jgi:hypothetical protein
VDLECGRGLVTFKKIMNYRCATQNCSAVRILNSLAQPAVTSVLFLPPPWSKHHMTCI